MLFCQWNQTGGTWTHTLQSHSKLTWLQISPLYRFVQQQTLLRALCNINWYTYSRAEQRIFIHLLRQVQHGRVPTIGPYSELNFETATNVCIQYTPFISMMLFVYLSFRQATKIMYKLLAMLLNITKWKKKYHHRWTTFLVIYSSILEWLDFQISKTTNLVKTTVRKCCIERCWKLFLKPQIVTTTQWKMVHNARTVHKHLA